MFQNLGGLAVIQRSYIRALSDFPSIPVNDEMSIPGGTLQFWEYMYFNYHFLDYFPVVNKCFITF